MPERHVGVTQATFGLISPDLVDQVGEGRAATSQMT
jgi:hypothetical protein